MNSCRNREATKKNEDHEDLFRGRPEGLRYGDGRSAVSLTLRIHLERRRLLVDQVLELLAELVD